MQLRHSFAGLLGRFSGLFGRFAGLFGRFAGLPGRFAGRPTGHLEPPQHMGLAAGACFVQQAVVAFAAHAPWALVGRVRRPRPGRVLFGALAVAHGLSKLFYVAAQISAT